MAKSLRCPAHPNGELIEDHRAGDMVNFFFSILSFKHQGQPYEFMSPLNFPPTLLVSNLKYYSKF